MWDTRVSSTGDHSGAWPRKRSGLVGVRHPHLRDVGGVSWRERREGGGKRERERETGGRRERERETIATCYFFYRYPPFFDEHPFRIYEKILEGKVEWPRHLEPNAKDLIKKLLVRDVTRRLGSLRVIILHVCLNRIMVILLSAHLTSDVCHALNCMVLRII